MTDTIVSRIAKALALAEGSSGHEAENAMAFAQRLASTYAIDLEVARRQMADKNKREVPIQKRISFDNAIARRNTKKSLVELFLKIGYANDVKCNIYHDSSGVIAFGFPSDIDMTERIFAVVAVQMIAGADAYLKTGEHRNETTTYYDTWGNPTTKAVDGRTARIAYYSSFTSRVGARLRDMKQEAVKEAATTMVTVTNSDNTSSTVSTELVLKEKALAVSDFYKETSNARGSWSGSSSSGFSRSGHSAGSRDGSRASLGRSTGIGGSRSSIGA